MEDVLSDESLGPASTAADQNRRLSETIAREQSRLRRFIAKRVPDAADAEDILQEVFSELVTAYRLMKPIEQVGAWLFRVARTRIIDSFRKSRPTILGNNTALANEEGDTQQWEDLLPSPDAGPEAAYAHRVLLDELDAALEELPEDQREVFVAHEIEGRTFNDLSAETGVGINTLLSRKRYAVLHLRRRLKAIYEEFTLEK